VASFVSMPLAEPSYQANTTGARLAGEESEPEDVDQVYTSSYLRDDNRPVRADWVPERVAHGGNRGVARRPTASESLLHRCAGIGRPDALTS
jgi:hypothetical protein